MKIIGVIPARYGSTRLPGKPIVDICGKPMIWWVYQRVRQVPQFTDAFVATDDERIASCCAALDIPYLMTSEACPNHIHRVYEVSTQIEADYYVSVNGDEPLIDPEQIEAVFPAEPVRGAPFFQSVYRLLTDPTEVLDSSNVKIVLDTQGRCMYQSRYPIPAPKASLDFQYKKAIGIECFNAEALAFFAHAPMGQLERIEDIDHLRFLENGVPIHYRQIESQALSVDTSSDLERVRAIIAQREGTPA